MSFENNPISVGLGKLFEGLSRVLTEREDLFTHWMISELPGVSRKFL